MNHTTGTEKKQRLEKGVGGKMEKACGIPSGTEAHHHESELTNC